MFALKWFGSCLGPSALLGVGCHGREREREREKCSHMDIYTTAWHIVVLDLCINMCFALTVNTSSTFTPSFVLHLISTCAGKHSSYVCSKWRLPTFLLVPRPHSPHPTVPPPPPMAPCPPPSTAQPNSRPLDC